MLFIHLIWNILQILRLSRLRKYRRRTIQRKQRHKRRVFMFRKFQQRRYAAFITFMILSHGLSPGRSIWKRERSDYWWSTVVNGIWNDRDFRENFRMSKDTYHFLCQELDIHIRKRNTNFRQCIKVEKRVAITLWRLATNAEYRTISHLFAVGRSTCCTIANETCKIITEHLMPNYIRFPSDRRLLETIRDFRKK